MLVSGLGFWGRCLVSLVARAPKVGGCLDLQGTVDQAENLNLQVNAINARSNERPG
jgi:hypothetical protein